MIDFDFVDFVLVNLKKKLDFKEKDFSKKLTKIYHLCENVKIGKKN